MSRLKRQLGISQGLSMLATSLLGTGVFVIPAIAASIADQSSLFAWGALIVLVLPIAFTFAALGRRFPHAGGPAHIAGRAFGAKAEKLTAFLFLSVLPVGLPAALAMATGFWQAVFDLSSLQIILIQLGTVATIVLLGLAGAKMSGHVQTIIALAIISIIAAMWWKGAPDSSDLQGFTQPSLSVVPALAVMFWCFVGIEAFTHLGEEFKRPERDFPIALILGVLVAGCVYWAASVLVLKYHAFGDQHMNTQSLPHLVALLFGPKAKWIAALVGYLACYASINIYLQGFARLLWSMADEGVLPKPLATLSSNKVPSFALAMVGLVCALCCAVAWMFELPIDDLIRYANGNFVLVYLIAMVAGVFLLKGWGKVLALLSSALCLFLFASLAEQGAYALLLSAVFWVFLLWRGKRQAKHSPA